MAAIAGGGGEHRWCLLMLLFSPAVLAKMTCPFFD